MIGLRSAFNIEIATYQVNDKRQIGNSQDITTSLWNEFGIDDSVCDMLVGPFPEFVQIRLRVNPVELI